ncbi:MAG TPA: Gfo/Idh/MocA family oxidoreductase, partial [Planctomycetota bacterium]|nr:Gfo/Idh/MocA family oxidoreductase [Planctomycetota bacterium]
MSKIRFGIIGFGGMGRGHAGYLSKGEVPGAELAAVCDISPDSLKWAKENYGDKVQTFTDPEQLFKAKCCNAIIIATQHYEHPPIAIKA